MSALPHRDWTVEDYLAFERASEEKHEFIGGDLLLMTGASRKHNLITLNTGASLHRQLADRDCEAYMSDMRVRIPRSKDYTYPDVVVVCDEPQFEDDELDTLLNPTVLIEVLSPSTEHYDRGTKFHLYREIVSLSEYILIAQDTPRVEHYIRQKDGLWLFSATTALDTTLTLPSINCTLALTDIYAKVTFESE